MTRILPAGTFTGTFDAASCQFVDGTPYVPYRLDLPVRGQIQIALTGNTTDFLLNLRDAAGNKVDSGASIARPIEAGSYTVLLIGAKPAQTGDFKVTTTFTAEAGMLCANFPNIGRGQVADGLLASSGCLALDGSPYEGYTLTTDGAGTLTVTVDSTDFTPAIAVRSFDGRQVAPPAGSPLNVVVSGDSQYVIVIGSSDKTSDSAGNKTGAYRVTTAFQSAGNETCRSRKTFTDSGSDSNTIGADSCFVTIAGSGDQMYYNYYNLTVPEPGLVDASGISGDFNATLKLFDGDGNLLASNAGGAGSDEQNGVQASLRAQLPAGSYRLQIFSEGPSGGAYSLKYAFTPGNPKPCTPAALNFGDRLTGTLLAESCRTSIGISDVYTLTVPTSGTVDLDMSAMAFNTSLVMRDSKANLIVRDDDVEGVGVSHIAADLPTGVYTIVAAASTGSGSYQLAAKFVSRDLPACTYAQTLDLNGGYIQRLGPGSCRASNGQPVDYYTFTLSTGALVLAVITSSEVDGYLTLYDAAGNILRTDDNTYGSNDPLIVQYLPAGTYKLGARDASSSFGGLYEIDLRTTVAPRPPFCTSRLALAPGDIVNGSITYTGCQYTGNTFADLYQINLTADATLDIRADSSEFDAYLLLLDSKGAEVDEDDDSGGNTNARINRALAAGTYTVVVKPFGDYTSRGKYTLTTK